MPNPSSRIASSTTAMTASFTARTPLHITQFADTYRLIVPGYSATAAAEVVVQHYTQWTAGIDVAVYTSRPDCPLDLHCQEMTKMRVLPRVVACVLVLLWTLSGRPRVVDANMFVTPMCNVTEESGLTHDCAQVISYLQFLDNADCCVHERREVDRCTTMHIVGTCRAQICSLPFVPLPHCQPCRVVAEYVRSVTNLCAQDVAGASRSEGYKSWTRMGPCSSSSTKH